MKRNELVKKLMTEGFSEKTLVNMSDKQIELLSSRVLTEQTVPVKGSVVMKKESNPSDIKKVTDTGTNVELREENDECECQKSDMKEEKPSAGLSAKKKSEIVKKAKSGGDIGKKGKGFEKVVAAAKKSGSKDPEAVAAAAMWKNVTRESEKEEDVDESARTMGFGYHGGLKSKNIFKAGNKRGNPGEPYSVVKEQDETVQWVEKLVTEKYQPMTTKGEITEMVSRMLNEQMENNKLPLDTEDCVYADGVSPKQEIAQQIANDNARAKFEGKFSGRNFIKAIETAHRTDDNYYRYIVGLKVREESGGEVDEPYTGKGNTSQGDLKEVETMYPDVKKTRQLGKETQPFKSGNIPTWMNFQSVKGQFAPTEVPTKAPTKTPTKSPNKTPRTPYNPGPGTNPNPKAKY